MYRFLLRPKFLAFHLLIVTLVVVMVNLGFWQLRRLDERRDQNAVVEAREHDGPAEVTTVLAPDDTKAEVEAHEWTEVEARGRYDAAGQVLVRNRSFEGQPGFHVLTPLVLADGTALVVNRGFVPLGDQPGTPPDVPAPPGGDVVVEGRLRPTQERGSIGPRDPATGQVTELARADIARLGQQLAYPLLPAYVELEASDPAPGDLPRLLPAPELDEGPHLSYAIQWFLFSTLAVAGWVVAVRKSARQRAQARAVAAEPDAPDGEVAGPTSIASHP